MNIPTDRIIDAVQSHQSELSRSLRATAEAWERKGDKRQARNYRFMANASDRTLRLIGELTTEEAREEYARDLFNDSRLLTYSAGLPMAEEVRSIRDKAQAERYRGAERVEGHEAHFYRLTDGTEVAGWYYDHFMSKQPGQVPAKNC